MTIKTMHSSYKSIFNGLSSALLLCLLMFGGSANIHASQRMRIYQPKVQRQARRIRFRHQNKKRTIRKTRRKTRRHHHTNWFRDGLNNRQLSARNWVSWHESRHEWKVLSYGGRCVGYFQLDPSYLGYSHGHVNLNHKHQVKVADAYAKSRYGSWVNAQHFWEAHNWY